MTPHSQSLDLHRLLLGPCEPQPVRPNKDLPISTCFLMRVQGLPPKRARKWVELAGGGGL